jgi:1-acyl-sn-glycerol-3-phosphate acyltransferase
MNQVTFFLARCLIRVTFGLATRIEVQGQQNIPDTAGYIAATNHVGRLDAGLVYCLIDRSDIIMLVAEKYRRSAITRWLAEALDGIWVDRFNADHQAVRLCLKRLKAGGLLVIAPEGTRSPTGNLMAARSGAGYLAAKSGVPILPVALTGTEDAMVKSRLRRLRRVPVTVRFGLPFRLPPIAASDRATALQAYDDEIMCRIAALLPEERRGAYSGHPRLKALLSGAA